MRVTEVFSVLSTDRLPTTPLCFLVRKSFVSIKVDHVGSHEGTEVRTQQLSKHASSIAFRAAAASPQRKQRRSGIGRKRRHVFWRRRSAVYVSSLIIVISGVLSERRLSLRSPTSCPHAWTINIFKLSQWTPQAGSGVSALKPNKGNGQRGRDLSDHGFTSSQEVTDHEERFRVSECFRLQTTVTLGAFDEMFNDAWVSALDPQPVTRRPPLGTPRPEFGPRQEETGPWEPFITRPELVLLHFSAKC
ncbi:hypothetical protein NQZ68_030541 [Dissostichus eleginoides]|nr:hypothetical protein NQZ68_030541 [Dissostichus eleginoides]